MRIPYCTSIGFILDFECDLDVDLEWEHGEPVAVINDVLVGGHSLLRHDDKLMADLGYRVMDIAEGDESVLDRLLENECVSWTGRGSNDPAGRFVERAS